MAADLARGAGADETSVTLLTERLELRPLPAAAACVLPDDRESAACIIGATVPTGWPASDLLDLLPRQSAASAEMEAYGIWVMIAREIGTVVGDIGFIGPPHLGTVEIGYSILPDRRRRGYATEAARAIVAWALEQPDVNAIVAGCTFDNLASIRILERIGFTRTGRRGGEVGWRLTR